jgi:NitT/TauT family transport system permease protein
MAEHRTPRVWAYATYAFIPVLLLGMWWLVTEMEWVGPIFLPTPSEIFAAAVQSWKDGSLVKHSLASTLRVLLGFLITLLLAFPVAVVMALTDTGRRLFQPLNSLLRYMPFPAFVPLLILWFGIGSTTQILVIMVGTFFQLTILIQDAFSSIRPEYLETARSMCLSPVQSFVRVRLPAALPQCYDAVRVGIGWAWTCLIVAEMVGAQDGLGYMILVGQRYLKTPDVFVGIIAIGLLGLVIDSILFALRPVLMPWSSQTR